jgi:hypothetical protein
MDFTAATTMSVFGGVAGLMGKVGSLTLVVASPEKFLMPMNSDSGSACLRGG